MKPVRRNISLIVTQTCNLNCSYCYENYKSKETMSFDRAFSIVEKHLSDTSTDFDECSIEVFGGEPFLNFTLIKQLCEVVWEKNWAKPYIFHTTTNGTLVHDEIQDWLLANSQRFFVSLSLDGTPDMQNTNRSNSFEKIDLPFFQTLTPKPPIKMTVSNETLPLLAEGVIFIHSLGFTTINNNLAYSIDWKNSRNVDMLTRELKKLITYYLAHPETTPCTFLNMKIEHQTYKEKKWCGTGISMAAYDTDGMDYPCQMFLPLSIGHEKAELSRHMDFSVTKNFIDDKCVDCLLHPICPTCYGSNYHERNNVAARNDQICQLTKVTALANSYFQTQRILGDKSLEKLDEKDYLIVKAALEIQNKIKIDAIFFTNTP